MDREVHLVRARGDELREHVRACEGPAIAGDRAEQAAGEGGQHLEYRRELERLASPEGDGLDPVPRAVFHEADELRWGPLRRSARSTVVVAEPARLGALVGDLDGDAIQGAP